VDDLGITEIELDRGPCFGTCPVFDIKLSRHAGYQYNGQRYVEPLGERSGRFPGYLFARLAELCIDLRILELEDNYPSDFDDGAFTRITIRHGGGLKIVLDEIVLDEGGGLAPARFWAFRVIVEVAMREAFEIEDRQVPPKKRPWRQK
jgi:hypothetical protein